MMEIQATIDSIRSHEGPNLQNAFQKTGCVAIGIAEKTVCLPHPFSNLDSIIVIKKICLNWIGLLFR